MKIPNKLTCLFLLVVSGLTAGCNQTVDYPAEFALADSLATYRQPEQALCILDSLKPSVSDVSEAIRHKFDLLYIKATDKAYRPFYTDSLILDVIRYYEKHPSHGQLAESYYYGGRVNTELGDATLAMQYYQKAYDVLKEMPDNAHTLRLRSNVCSNIARTLHYLDSDSIGVPYILEALKCDSLMGERSLMVYEFRDLAYAAWEYGRLDSAEMYLEQARIIAFQIQDSVLFSLMQNEFANFYIDARKDYNRVIPLLYYLKNPYESNKSAAFSTLTKYYYNTGQFNLAIPITSSFCKWEPFMPRQWHIGVWRNITSARGKPPGGWNMPTPMCLPPILSITLPSRTRYCNWNIPTTIGSGKRKMTGSKRKTKLPGICLSFSLQLP